MIKQVLMQATLDIELDELGKMVSDFDGCESLAREIMAARLKGGLTADDFKYSVVGIETSNK